MVSLKKMFFLTVIIIFQVNLASAYIDPGTGGMVLGSIWPFIVAVFAAIGGFFVKFFYKPIKRGFVSLWTKFKNLGR